MIISSIETLATEYVSLARVRTDEGDEGWGLEIEPEWIALSDYRVSYNKASS